MQEWYKKKYESYLFKNKNDFYNLIYFIRNARAQRIPDEELRKKLGKAGWGGEQITYAIKKFDGKKVGMWEIPLFRGSERRKIQEEMIRRGRIARF